MNNEIIYLGGYDMNLINYFNRRTNKKNLMILSLDLDYFS